MNRRSFIQTIVAGLTIGLNYKSKKKLETKEQELINRYWGYSGNSGGGKSEYLIYQEALMNFHLTRPSSNIHIDNIDIPEGY